MEENLRNIYQHMLGLGCGALTHAVTHASTSSVDNPYWPELSVLQAAHAAEILIKARIAQEHPLLIFDQIPKPDNLKDNRLNLRHLAEKGKTLDYGELPDRLWSVTGIRIPNLQTYTAFGRLRNAIQHFVAPEDGDISREALKFIFDVIDPFINQCWNLFAIDHNEDCERYTYLVEGLVRNKIKFLISPKMLREINEIEFWITTNPTYQQQMQQRMDGARAGFFGIENPQALA
jgi:hypothetical protein